MNATKHVIDALLSNQQLKAMTKGAIHPVIARYGTDCPYIIVRTDAAEMRRSKAGHINGVTYSLSIAVVADSYNELMQLVQLVEQLDTNKYEVNGYRESYEEPDKLVAEININYSE